MKDYYQLELDDMVIELNNKDSVIEEQEQQIIELEERIKSLETALTKANHIINKTLFKGINEILGEKKWTIL